MLIAQGTYAYTIPHFGDYAALPFITGPLLGSLVLAGILAFVVQVPAPNTRPSASNLR